MTTPITWKNVGENAGSPGLANSVGAGWEQVAAGLMGFREQPREDRIEQRIMASHALKQQMGIAELEGRQFDNSVAPALHAANMLQKSSMANKALQEAAAAEREMGDLNTLDLAERTLLQFVDPKTGRIKVKAFEKAGRDLGWSSQVMEAAITGHRNISGITAQNTADIATLAHDRKIAAERIKQGYKGTGKTDFLSGSQAPNWRIWTSDADAVAENEVLYNKYPDVSHSKRKEIILGNMSGGRVLDMKAAESQLKTLDKLAKAKAALAGKK